MWRRWRARSVRGGCRSIVGSSDSASRRIRSGDNMETMLERGAPLGRYLVLERIERDGTVYAAYDPELSRRVAIEILGEGKGGEQRGREARAMAKLSDPHVITVL